MGGPDRPDMVLPPPAPDVMQAAAANVAEYRALKDQIAQLETRLDAVKDELHEMLWNGEAPGHVWPFPGLGTVRVVSGRHTSKLDRAKLAKAGVAADVLDAATVETVGEPSLRVEAWIEEK